MTTLPEPAAIRRIADELAQPRHRIEAAFVAAGTRLTEGAALLNTLGKLFEALPAALSGPEVESASAHLSAAIDGMSWLEMDSLPNPLFDMLLEEAPVVEDGRLRLSGAPGLGDVVRQEVFERFEVR